MFHAHRLRRLAAALPALSAQGLAHAQGDSIGLVVGNAAGAPVNQAARLPAPLLGRA
ncbi:hypothetical protein [Xylophilus sp. ASV27]|uniref:hypothetical protein n=1 Tax=Xylophilus sp. ASV27 TaxID=2795129 RepID=UPI0018EA6E10|nr:hypothetical protein [Xylophilus sp. ASV27]